MAEAPANVVLIVKTGDPLTGIGEIFTPTIAPAVGNAILKLTGKRVRQVLLTDAF